MKIKNILYSAAVAATVMSAASCSKLLDIPQHGVLNYNTYYNTDEQVESAATAMYLEARGWEFNVTLCKNMLTDDFYAGGAGRGDNTDLEFLNEFAFDSEQSYIESMFKTYYNLIYKANVILGHVNPEGNDVCQRVRAEAKVMRAFAYFDLITMWGNPPLVDHELLPSEYSKPNGTTEELWGLVEKDLTEAIASNKLPEKTGKNDTETWRVTKQFAQALLGKAYLWQEKYKDAAEQFTAVVNSKKYDLLPTNEYENLFRANNKHNVESLFESNRVHNPNSEWDNFSMFYLMINWRMDQMTWPSDTPIMNTGWGFCVPSQDLYDDFVKCEGEKGSRLNQSIKTYEQIQTQMGFSVKSKIINDGFFMWKKRVLAEDRGTGNDYVYNANIVWMRYAEVLLCGAEASLKANDKGTALTYINMIRERAGASKLSDVTMDDIKLEKRCELFGEGQRFQDLVRWGDAQTKLANNGKVYPILYTNGTVEYVSTGRTNYGFKDKHNRLPYPATETRLNPNCKQNEGY